MEILLIEDHLPTAQSVSLMLGQSCCVHHVSTKAAAEQALAQRSYTAILSDLQLPDGSGLALCSHHEQTPVLIISGTHDVSTKVAALEAGADDYITKPFAFIELRARLYAALRRRAPRAEGIEHCGTFSVNHHTYEVCYDTVTAALTVCEYQVVRQLLRQRDVIVSKDTLQEDIAGASTISSANCVEAHIKNLRKKLRLPKKNAVIETVYGLGYRFNTKYT